MSQQPRRHFSGPEKVAILKRHLVEGTPVSDLCDELELNPNVFYAWQRQLFENAQQLFDNGRKAKAVEDAQQTKIQQLEAKLLKKNEVMAELMEALTEQKKVLGNSDQVLGPPRLARPGRRFRPLLVRQNRHLGRALHALDRHRHQQVPRLETPLRQSQ